MLKDFLRIRSFQQECYMSKSAIKVKNYSIHQNINKIQTTKIVNCNFFTFSSFLIFCLNADHFSVQTRLGTMF